LPQPALLESCVTADPKTIPSVSGSEEPSVQVNDGVLRLGSEAATQPPGRRRPNLWLLRIRALLFVTLCATFGVLLLILPWTPKWTDNPLLLSFPQLREIVASGFVRGVSTGLGVLDLWLGFWEAIHYHESSD
jgi:hypothetical protein